MTSEHVQQSSAPKRRSRCSLGVSRSLPSRMDRPRPSAFLGPRACVGYLSTSQNVRLRAAMAVSCFSSYLITRCPRQGLGMLANPFKPRSCRLTLQALCEAGTGPGLYVRRVGPSTHISNLRPSQRRHRLSSSDLPCGFLVMV